jgi:hypothetical protein
MSSRVSNGSMRLVALTLAVLLGISTEPTRAQEVGSAVKIVHSPPDLRIVETRQAWLPISLELRNTKSINTTIRLVGSRDGRLIDLSFPKGTLNANDNPEYKVEIPTPTSGMSYQFVIHQPDASLITSERFSIQRPCIQSFRVSVPENSPDFEFKQKVGDLVSRVRTLEREIAQLDGAYRSLEELKKNIPEQ